MGWPVTARSQSPGTWQPPDAWDCAPLASLISKIPTSPIPTIPRSRNSEERSPAASDLAHIQRTVQRMEAASYKIVLERLKEEWLEVADPSIYRELELEKQLWMLSALRSLNKRKDPEQITSLSLKKSPNQSKVLSLYENYGQ